MKQSIDLLTVEITTKELNQILKWKKTRFDNDDPSLSIGECLELLTALTYTYHKDYSDGRFFNNIIINSESLIAWDGEGESFIDTLFYEIRSLLKKRLALSPAF